MQKCVRWLHTCAIQGPNIDESGALPPAVRHRRRSRGACRCVPFGRLARVHPGASVSNANRAAHPRAAGHLGYRVNRLAQSLINARSNIIGLVGTDLHQPFHAECLATFSGALLAEGFQCMLLNAANAEHDMGALIERVLEYRVAAIVVMNGTPPSRIVKECFTNGVPVVLVNKLLPGFAVDTVVADHAAGGREPPSTFLPPVAAGLQSFRAARGPRAFSVDSTHFATRAAEAGVLVRAWQGGPDRLLRQGAPPGCASRR